MESSRREAERMRLSADEAEREIQSRIEEAGATERRIQETETLCTQREAELAQEIEKKAEREVALQQSRERFGEVKGLSDDVDARAMVEFNPPQVHPWEDTRPYSNSPWASFWIPPTPPEDGRWITEVTFDRPGTYILRGRADDGGLFTDEQVTVNVRGPVS